MAELTYSGAGYVHFETGMEGIAFGVLTPHDEGTMEAFYDNFHILKEKDHLIIYRFDAPGEIEWEGDIQWDDEEKHLVEQNGYKNLAIGPWWISPWMSGVPLVPNILKFLRYFQQNYPMQLEHVETDKEILENDLRFAAKTLEEMLKPHRWFGKGNVGFTAGYKDEDGEEIPHLVVYIRNKRKTIPKVIPERWHGFPVEAHLLP